PLGEVGPVNSAADGSSDHGILQVDARFGCICLRRFQVGIRFGYGGGVLLNFFLADSAGGSFLNRLAASQIRLRERELGLPNSDLGKRLVMDGLVFIRLDREQRLTFLNVVAVLEINALQVAEDSSVDIDLVGGLGLPGVFVVIGRFLLHD